jgi:hypothetical protein
VGGAGSPQDEDEPSLLHEVRELNQIKSTKPMEYVRKRTKIAVIDRATAITHNAGTEIAFCRREAKKCHPRHFRRAMPLTFHNGT